MLGRVLPLEHRFDKNFVYVQVNITVMVVATIEPLFDHSSHAIDIIRYHDYIEVFCLRPFRRSSRQVHQGHPYRCPSLGDPSFDGRCLGSGPGPQNSIPAQQVQAFLIRQG